MKQHFFNCWIAVGGLVQSVPVLGLNFALEQECKDFEVGSSMKTPQVPSHSVVLAYHTAVTMEARMKTGQMKSFLRTRSLTFNASTVMPCMEVRTLLDFAEEESGREGDA